MISFPPYWLQPARAFWLCVYAAVLVYHVVRANVDVAYRVLHPAMPINPGIVKIKTSLQTPTAITALCNSITLTPGTLTVHASEDGTIYVHWIYVSSMDEAMEKNRIVGRLEWYLKRIYE